MLRSTLMRLPSASTASALSARLVRAHQRALSTSPSSWMASSPRIIEITTQDEFKSKVLESKVPVVVDFWAAWCFPCKALTPILERVINGFPKDVLLAKVNVEQAEEVAQKYEISLLPTLLAFKDGKQVDKFIGLGNDTKISKFVQDLTK